MRNKYRLTLTITHIGGTCNAGCRIGQKYELSSIKTDSLCGTFYNSLFPTLCTFDYGGEIWFLPDKNKMDVRCPDYINDVRGTLVRELAEKAK